MKFLLLFIPITIGLLFFISSWERDALRAQQARIEEVKQQYPNLRPGAIYCISGDSEFKVIFRRLIDPQLMIASGGTNTARVTNQQGTYTYAVPAELKECQK